MAYTLKDKYKLLDKIDPSKRRQVIRVEHTVTGATLAMKIDDNHALSQEITMAGKLAHPNILPIIDADEQGGWLVSQFGCDLEQLVRKHPPSYEESCNLLAQISEGLQFAHENGVIHCDLKPKNVIVINGTPKITDFGIAKTERTATNTLTATTKFEGTLKYMAPELFEGKPATAQVDIYALGIMLYELATGNAHPVKGYTSPRRIKPDLPLHAEEFYQIAADPDPTKRFKTAKDAAAFLSLYVTKSAEQKYTAVEPTIRSLQAVIAAQKDRVKKAVESERQNAAAEVIKPYELKISELEKQLAETKTRMKKTETDNKQLSELANRAFGTLIIGTPLLLVAVYAIGEKYGAQINAWSRQFFGR